MSIICTRFCGEIINYFHDNFLSTASKTTHYNTVELRYIKKLNCMVSTLKKFYERHYALVNPYNVAVSRLISDIFPAAKPETDFLNPWHYYSCIFKSLFCLIGIVGEGCLPCNDYILFTDAWLHPIYFGLCLSGWTFLILSLRISTLWCFEMRFLNVDLRLN